MRERVVFDKKGLVRQKVGKRVVLKVIDRNGKGKRMRAYLLNVFVKLFVHCPVTRVGEGWLI